MRKSWLMLGLVVGAALQAGCWSPPPPAENPPPAGEVVDLDGALSESARADRPIVILAGEFGSHGTNAAERDLLDTPSIKEKSAKVKFLRIDLSVSRNRATAARYHVVTPPVLVCLSPMGVIVSRDEGVIAADLIVKRTENAISQSAVLDPNLKALEANVTKNEVDLQARLALVQFLLGRGNAREAIPHLAILAGPATKDVGIRVQAWVELARAHLWMIEPEKGRHEAKNLIATWGPTSPDAIAGGNLLLGMQDATAKRYALARQEFHISISAAPASAYAVEAGKALAELPGGNH